MSPVLGQCDSGSPTHKLQCITKTKSSLQMSPVLGQCDSGSPTHKLQCITKTKSSNESSPWSLIDLHQYMGAYKIHTMCR